MWISKEADRLKQELREERQARITAEVQLAIVKNTEEWLRVQLNTLQLQNAEFIKQLTHVSVPVARIERQTENPNDQPEWAKGALPTLEDPGDEIATLLGIRHGSQGELVYDGR